MKRTAELRGLSEDHHHGLALAQRAKRAAAGPAGHSTEEAWADIERQFEAELEPHFGIEESLLAPALQGQGESELVSRLYEEHAALRECVGPSRGRSPADLLRFGELLERHIRFEERELFVVAEQRLGADALRAVAQACHARRVPRR